MALFMGLGYFPNGSDVSSSDTEATMFAPAGAMKDVDVGSLLVGMRLESLDVVILGVAAAGLYELVVLKVLDELLRQQLAKLGDGVAWAGWRKREWTSRCAVTHYVIVHSDAPKSSVMVSPEATVKVAP